MVNWKVYLEPYPNVLTRNNLSAVMFDEVCLTTEYITINRLKLPIKWNLHAALLLLLRCPEQYFTKEIKYTKNFNKIV